MMRPDYAKEIATKALTNKTASSTILLTDIATYCIRELGYHMTSGELLRLIDSLRDETEEAA